MSIIWWDGTKPLGGDSFRLFVEVSFPGHGRLALFVPDDILPRDSPTGNSPVTYTTVHALLTEPVGVVSEGFPK